MTPNSKNNYCVIMAGGIGSRFWPRSCQKLPKQFLNTWYRLSWNDAASGDKDKNTATTRVNYGSFVTHSLGLTWTPKIPNFWDFAAGVAIENITDEEYRYVNGSWGYGRGVRVWVSGRF